MEFSSARFIVFGLVWLCGLQLLHAGAAHAIARDTGASFWRVFTLGAWLSTPSPGARRYQLCTWFWLALGPVAFAALGLPR